VQATQKLMEAQGQDIKASKSKDARLVASKSVEETDSSVSAFSFLSRGVEHFDDSLYNPRLALDPIYLFQSKHLIHPDSPQKLGWDTSLYILSVYSVRVNTE